MLHATESRAADPTLAGKLGRDPVLQTLLTLVVGVQVAHACVLAFSSHAVVASNAFQMLAAGLAVAVCAVGARRTSEARQRRLWLQMAATFVLWLAGQTIYFEGLFRVQSSWTASCSDTLWLALALPILMLAAHPAASQRRDPVGWLDRAQSCALFAVIFVLVNPHPGILRVPTAYDVENPAMTLAVLLRFSIAQEGEERDFYRSAVIFTGAYTASQLLNDAIASVGVKPGTLIDLCWSAPFTLFSAMTILGERARPSFARWSTRQIAYQQHLQVFSALGMAVLALAGSALVARHSLLVGLPLMLGSFLIFAARTCIRELQLHHAHASLEQASLHDPLTGLANRSLVKQTLTRALEEGRGSGRRRTALLFIDLDRFKIINDGLGHAFGDLLLIEVARLLGSLGGPRDQVGRHGGDEFVLLLYEADEAEASAAAQRVIDCLRRPLLLQGRVIHITASVGVVLADADATADSMLQDADCAMFRAKNAGKDRAQRFAPRMLAAARNKLELETALRASLAAGHIEVHYQPIFSLPDQTIQGFEALARWRHPDRGMISPNDFIPIAEDTGLILELGRQVMRQACYQCQAWNERFCTQLRIGVNVSAHQFSNPALLDEILKTLRDSRLDPTLLKLEVTESVLVNRYQTVEEVLTRARARGIGVCLDDFGTGYSSLSYLLRFPFDLVKIDRSFVRHLDRDPRRAEMVRMILQMASALKKKTIAEGVESAEELARLKSFGADMAQGFLLSRPLTRRSAEELLTTSPLVANPIGAAVPRARPPYPSMYPRQPVSGDCASAAPIALPSGPLSYPAPH